MVGVEKLPDLYEIVDGEIREKETSFYTSGIASSINQFLGYYVRNHRMGKVYCFALFRINKALNLQRRPDVAFVSTDQIPWNQASPNEEAPDIVPELMVEVVRPTNSHDDVENKIDEYFAAGTKRVWIVKPIQRRVAIYTSPSDSRILKDCDILEDDLFPGFQLLLSELFLIDAVA